jgi:predicted transcriptional regulator YheO
VVQVEVPAVPAGSAMTATAGGPVRSRRRAPAPRAAATAATTAAAGPVTDASAAAAGLVADGRADGPDGPDGADAADGAEAMMATVAGLVERLGAAILPTTEIVLHDLRKLPHSIVAVAGNVTDRGIGDPPTDVLLAHLMAGARGDLLGYPTLLPDGRQLVCSTIILRTSAGEPVGALCINNDVTHWLLLRGVADSALGAGHPLEALAAGLRTLEPPPAGRPASGVIPLPGHGERFARSVPELADHMISRCIDEVGIPVALMKKEHKLRVVAALQDQGMFLIRDSVETVAGSLGVSRFTIYNYLNEIGAGSGDEVNPASGVSGDATTADRVPVSGSGRRAPRRVRRGAPDEKPDQYHPARPGRPARPARPERNQETG